MSNVQAFTLAALLWCSIFLLFYRQRTLYVLFVLIAGVVGGPGSLEYVPLIWLLVDPAITVFRLFRGGRDG